MDCSEVLLNGIYDIYESSNERDYYKSYINWMKMNKIDSYSKAKGIGVSATVPIEGIMATFGLDHNEENFSKSIFNLENYDSLHEKDKSNLQSLVKTINPKVIEAWENCMNRKGTHIWVSTSKDPNDFFINARYVGEGDSVNRYIKDIVYDKEEISTIGGFFLRNGRITRASFEDEVKSQIFTRINNNPISMVVEPNHGDSLRLSLPAIDEFTYGNRGQTQSQNPSFTVFSEKETIITISTEVFAKPKHDLNGCSIRLNVYDQEKGDVIQQLWGWERFKDLLAQKSKPPTRILSKMDRFKLSKDKSYRFEVYFDNVENLDHWTEFRWKY